MMRFIISLILAISLLAVPVFSLGLSGTRLGTIIYEPGKEIVNEYSITDTSFPVEIQLGRDLTEFVSLSEIKDNKFTLKIKFPDYYLTPGDYYFSLTATEKPEENHGISSVVSVTKTFLVKVYSHDKDLAVSFNVPNVNAGTPVKTTFDIESLSYSDIDSLQGEVSFFDDEVRFLKKADTNKVSLKSLDKITLSVALPTQDMPPSKYLAQGKIFYDGLMKEVNSTFLVGNLDLLLKSYTSTLPRGFSEFSVKVFNNFGDTLKNVYAKVSISGEELLQTPSINIGPWQEGELKGLVRINLAPGTYDGTLRLFFEGEEKEEPITVIVVESISPELAVAQQQIEQKNQLIIFLSTMALILIVLIIFLKNNFRKQKKKSEEF